jgi:hypothetical protein
MKRAEGDKNRLEAKLIQMEHTCSSVYSILGKVTGEDDDPTQDSENSLTGGVAGTRLI